MESRGTISFYLTLLLFVGSALLASRDRQAEKSAFHALPYLSSRITGTTFPKILTEPDGSRYRLTHPPKRVVSTVLMADEVLLDLISPERLVALSSYARDSYLSNISGRIPSHVTAVTGNIEAILSLEPDIVFVSAFSGEALVKQLLSSSVPVVRLGSYASFDDVKNNISVIAAAVGEDKKGKEIIAKLDVELAAVLKQPAEGRQPSVLYFSDGNMTVGAETLIDEEISLAGGINVARQAGLHGDVPVSSELMLRLQPEIILLARWSAEESPLYQMLLQNPVLQTIPAIAQKSVYSVDGSALVSVSQYSVTGLKQIKQILQARR